MDFGVPKKYEKILKLFYTKLILCYNISCQYLEYLINTELYQIMGAKFERISFFQWLWKEHGY